MAIFVDTSALLAVLSGDDEAHAVVRPVWERLMLDAEPLLTTNYVVLELHALVQRRFGMPGISLLESAFVPVMDIHWVGREEHQQAAAAVAAAGRRDLSLVDCASFVIMRRLGVRSAFTLDAHFSDQGFIVLPER